MKRELFCNRCKKSCCKEIYTIDNPIRDDNGATVYSNEYLKICGVWGYWSKRDTRAHGAMLCEDCFEDFITFMGGEEHLDLANYHFDLSDSDANMRWRNFSKKYFGYKD